MKWVSWWWGVGAWCRGAPPKFGFGVPFVIHAVMLERIANIWRSRKSRDSYTPKKFRTKIPKTYLKMILISDTIKPSQQKDLQYQKPIGTVFTTSTVVTMLPRGPRRLYPRRGLLCVDMLTSINYHPTCTYVCYSPVRSRGAMPRGLYCITR